MRTFAIAAILSLAPCAWLHAQRTDTRFELLASGLDEAPVTYTLPARSMIGQTQHTFTLVLDDAEGQTCAGGIVDIYAEGSGDNSAWVRAGAPVTSIQQNQYGAYTALLRADVAVPYLRLQVAAFDTTNCTLSVFYAGTLAPVAAADQPLTLEVLTLADGVTNGDLFSTIVNPEGRNTHRIFVDTSGCTSYFFKTQIQVGYGSAGPWESRGYAPNFSEDSHFNYRTYVLGPTLYGAFPLIRVFVPTGSLVVDCDVEVYYYGTTESAVTPDVGDPLQIVTTGVTASNTVTIISASGTDRNNWAIRGMYLENPCAAGTVTLSGSVDGAITSAGPSSQMVWPLLSTPQEHALLPNQTLSLIGSSLSASCTANVTLWVSQRWFAP